MSSDSELDFDFHPPRRGNTNPATSIIIPQASKPKGLPEQGRGRSRGRGRGRGRGGFNRREGAQHATWQPNDPIPSRPLGDLISKIPLSSIHTSSENTTGLKIENTRYVASYNWLDRETATILIPGMPPTWTPPKSNRPLRQDRGEYFRDPNAARYPSYPIEPIIRAVYTLEPNFSPHEIDLVACGSTLGNLLCFARSIENPFRFDAELVGNTLFLIRRENSPGELIPDVRGYGHTFPEEYTTWHASTQGSVSHQRLVRYSLGGLTFLVRSEADGYLPELVYAADTDQASPKPKPSSSVIATTTAITAPITKDDSLSALISSTDKSFTISGARPTNSTTLHIQSSTYTATLSPISLRPQFSTSKPAPRTQSSTKKKFILVYG